MLSLYNRVSAPIGDKKYTLFADTDKHNLYYIMPDYPSYLTRDDDRGKPFKNFSLVWYYGATGKPARGICTFTVALEQPNTTKPEIRNALAKAIKSDSGAQKRAKALLEMAKAEKKGDTTKAEELRKELGILDDEAYAEICKKYHDGASEDLYLDAPGDNYDFKPVPYSTGSVTVQTWGTQDAYNAYEKDTSNAAAQPKEFGKYTANPSLLSDNAAVVTCDLTEFGANLFWHSLGGPSFDKASEKPEGYVEQKTPGVVRVVYDVGIQGMLPAATATVRLTQDIINSLKEHKYKDTWGKETTDSVSKTTNIDIDNATTIVIPDSSAVYGKAADGKPPESLRAFLQEWAKGQLAEMIRKQLPNPDKIAVGDDKILQEDTRSISLQEGILMTFHPQGMLDKITGDKETKDRMFVTLNLKNMPYAPQSLTLYGPGTTLLTERKVERLIVSNIDFAGKPLEFTPTTSGTSATSTAQEVTKVVFDQTKTLAGTTSLTGVSEVILGGKFDVKQKDQPFQYSLEVQYSDGTPSYNTGLMTTKISDSDVKFQQSDLGVLFAVIDGKGLPWGILEEVVIDFEPYGEGKQDLPSVTLTPTEKTTKLVQPLGKALYETEDGKPSKLKYRATFNLKDPSVDPIKHPSGSGFTHEGVTVATSNDQTVTLKFPYGNGRTETYEFRLATTLDAATIKLQYILPLPGAGASLTLEREILLPASTAPTEVEKWSVPKGTGARLQVLSATATKTGAEEPLDLSPSSTNVVNAATTRYRVTADKIVKF